jgi:hypothetical protein
LKEKSKRSEKHFFWIYKVFQIHNRKKIKANMNRQRKQWTLTSEMNMW